MREERVPTAKEAKMGSSIWAILTCTVISVWSYFRLEWWSPVLAVLALFLFAGSLGHSIPAMVLTVRRAKG